MIALNHRHMKLLDVATQVGLQIQFLLTILYGSVQKTDFQNCKLFSDYVRHAVYQVRQLWYTIRTLFPSMQFVVQVYHTDTASRTDTQGQATGIQTILRAPARQTKTTI
jgi:hypothetical protein